MSEIRTERLAADAGADTGGIRRAADLLAQGGTVAFPTETVYGLGADARRDASVAAVFAAKGRPRFNPLIVHVASSGLASEIGEILGEAAMLANAFWPGPLTLVVPRQPDAGISDLVTAGLQTVALRVPSAPTAQALLSAFGGPLAAPSANPSGRVSPTTAAHVLEGLDGRIAAVLDGGACAVGLESTIVGFGPEPRILRPGAIPIGAMEAVLGSAIAPAPASGGAVAAPGQLASHYAPAKTVRLNAAAPEPGELWLGFGEGPAHRGINLSPEFDLAVAAARLFSALRELDAMDGSGIAVAPVPEEGLGVAINDRLRRAAAPRG